MAPPSQSELAQYELVTRWTIPARVERVWAELMKPEDWPTWWKGVVRVQLVEPGDGIGALRRMTWRSALPYQLTFDMRTVRVDQHRSIEGVATGELSGRGIWTLSPTAQNSTDVRYDWIVEANKPWMRTLAPVAKPLFAWNHGVVMEWGRKGLLTRLAESPGPVITAQ